MKKILIIRLGAIGDVIHTSNLYRSIKKKHPDIEIHYLTSAAIKPLLEADISLAKVIAAPQKFKLFSKETKELISVLKKENYSLVLNLQPSLKTRLLVLSAGIKKQLIYKKDFHLHAVKNFWQTGLKAFPDLEEIKDLKLYLPQNALEKAAERLKDLRRPAVIINAGGMFSKRQGRAYPLRHWLTLAAKIEETFNASIIFTGAEEDAEFLKPLEKIKNSVNFIGKLSLLESCAVISQADLMISGDSGPLHAACALGVKSTGLFGSMPVNRTGGYCNCINIVSEKKCVPCNRRKCRYIKRSREIYAPCMEEISPDRIFEEVRRAFLNAAADKK